MDLILSDIYPYSATYFSAQGANPGPLIFIARTGQGFIDRKDITIEHIGGEGSEGGVSNAGAPFAEINLHSILFGGDNVTIRGREVQILDHGWK